MQNEHQAETWKHWEGDKLDKTALKQNGPAAKHIYLKPTGWTDEMDLQQNRTWSKMDLHQKHRLPQTNECAMKWICSKTNLYPAVEYTWSKTDL